MLVALFHELNALHFGNELPPPRLEWNSRLSSSAGRFAPGSRNPLFPRCPLIEIASYLKEIPESEFHIRDTMLHEMVHYILWHRRKPYGHTAEFHEILKRVGARRYNTVPKERKVKHWYKCPGCHTVIPARRAMRRSACLACCKKHNQGYYSDRFRLEPTSAPNPTAQFPAPSSPRPQTEAPLMQVGEVIRRLEELKKMLVRG